MKLFDTLFGEFLVLLCQVLQIVPLIGVKEVHEVEEFTDVVVQRRLKIEVVCSSCHEEDKMKDTNPSKNDTMYSIELIEFLEDETRIALHYIDHISSNTMRHA